jgi:hypothetical protein
VRAAAFAGEGQQNTGGDLVLTVTMSNSNYLDYNKNYDIKGEQRYIYIKIRDEQHEIIDLETSKQSLKILNKRLN